MFPRLLSIKFAVSRGSLVAGTKSSWLPSLSIMPQFKALSSVHDETNATTTNDNNIIATKSDDINREIIQRWMKWNTSKTFRYEPNLDLIAKIGTKESPPSPLDQFRDLVPTSKRKEQPVGRSWSVNELRRKSYEDLHKLWYILYKERNMLLTESNLARRHGYQMVQPERRKKVRKSMGAIKHVLGERKREKIADYRLYLEEMKRVDELMAKGGPFKVSNYEIDDSSMNEMEDAMHVEANNMELAEQSRLK